MLHNGRLIVCGITLAFLMLGTLGCQPDASEPLAADSATVLVVGEPDSAEVVLPVLETYADTLARRVYEASGGLVWEKLPYLRFNFAVARDGVRQPTVKHFWNRRTDDYRVELRGPGGQSYVVLFNIVSREGEAYWKGNRLDPLDDAEHLTTAYRRYINDTYWLLAPFKLFDPGVNRAYAPDSSDATTEVLHLTFGDVGLTPGDQYWLFVDKQTGRLVRWTYVLESDGPDAAPRSYVWDSYEEFVTPSGSIHFSTRKRGYGTTFVIYTDAVETPSLVPEDMFTAPEPRLDQ